VLRLRLLVRSRKDAKAAEASLEKFYRGFDYQVESLGGLRGETLAREAESRATPFTLILLPEREASLVDPGRLPPFARIVPVASRDLRNLRLEQIASLIARGRALLRLSARWDPGRSSYILDSPRPPQGFDADPQADAAILYSEGLRDAGELLSVRLEGHALVLLREGEMRLHYAGTLVGGFTLERHPPAPYKLAPAESPRRVVGLREVFEANTGLLRLIASSTIAWMGEAAGDARRALVPWSGGKDSTAALLLAVEFFGSNNVTAIHVDTGLEYPEAEDYIEDVASRLGVEVVRARAGLDAEARSRGLPRRGERWCTGLKLEALSRAVHSIAKRVERPIVVVGDRDAESQARSRRPPLRVDPYHGLKTLAPLKLLGAAHTLLLPMLWGIEPNPLYARGLYRLGCFTCPYMSSWDFWVFSRRVAPGIAERRPDALDLLRSFLEGRGSRNYLQSPHRVKGRGVA
jgi:3'-phosphoadenosine 5'-phosphosulfate sulfotransferase (PAPS reductase)/FAD synthetase/3'-phosphoadenosine 5'-phosphosulfate sulfotransferase